MAFSTRSLLGAVVIASLLPPCQEMVSPEQPDPAALLLVANKQEASLSLIDVASGQTSNIATGDGPHEVAVSPSGRTALVTDYGAQTAGSSLTIVDLATRQTRKIDLGIHRRSHGAAFLGGDDTAVVTVEANRAVLVIDVAGGKVARVISTDQNGSHMIAVPASAKVGYTANISSGSITEINFATGATRSLPVAPQTEGIAVTPDGKQVWVGSNQLNTVTVIDVATWKAIDTLSAPGVPYRIVISPDGRLAVATTPQANRVRVFDVASRRELAVVDMPGPVQPAMPVGATISADSRWLYVACQGSQTAEVVDLQTFRVVKSLPTGLGPDGIAVTVRR